MTTKNKKSTVTIEWPTSHFTIEDVQTKYPDSVNITLRFRVNKALENKEIVLIGKIKPSIGRPKKVFAKVNPTKELIEAAKAAGVISGDTTTVTVAQVSSDKNSRSVVPATATTSVATQSTVSSS
jgi:hypothetical protein